MIKINVVAVGKIKEKYFTDAILEYQKRLSRFCEFSITEVSEENYSKIDDAIIEKIKAKEEQNVIPYLKGYVIAMAIEGKKYSSASFAKKIQSIADAGNGTITFLIGGSYGMTDTLKKRANELISFSDMTFPHTFFRAMLVEQIYRAFSILGGTPYHK